MRVGEALSGVHRIFLDTPPVIYHIEGTSRYVSLTTPIFLQIRSGDVQAVTSSVTLAECLIGPLRRGDPDLMDRFHRAITRGTNTLFVGVDPVVERAAAIRAKHALSLTDALQAAAAIATGCDALLTNDRDFRRLTEIDVLLLDELEP